MTKKSDNYLVITRETVLPADLTELIAESRKEGFDFLARLVRDWDSGQNRFDSEGEALFLARFNGRLVGLCGLNRDPYLNDDQVARLRHLYVRRDSRRKGVGSKLVIRTLELAKQHFQRVRLRTETAFAFYESAGFYETNEEDATHAISV